MKEDGDWGMEGTRECGRKREGDEEGTRVREKEVKEG